MATVPPTRAQVERDLSHQIQALYRDQLGHRPSKVDCKLLEEKLVIVMDGSITKPEQLLTQEGHEDLAEQVRLQLEQTIQTQLKALIEEVLQVPVLDLLSDATLETGRSGIIAILSHSPTVRSPAPSRRQKDSTTPNEKEPTRDAS